MKIPFLGDMKQNTTEKISILMIFLGLVIYGLGTLFSIFVPVGLSAILAMLGALLIFIFTVTLVLFWFFRERSE